MSDHHIRILVELDGKLVVERDQMARGFSVELVNGTYEVPGSEAISAWVIREPSGEHSLSVSWTDVPVATRLLSFDTVGAADEAPFVRESGAPGETRTHDL